MKLRALVFVIAGFAAAAFAGCSNATNTVTVSPSPSPTLAGATYIAIGDSLTAAFGSSACGNQNPNTCITSPTQPGSPQVLPNGRQVNGYAQLFANALSVTRSPFTFAYLGVGGAETGPSPLGLAQNPGAGNILNNPAQLPAVPGLVSTARSQSRRVIVSLFIGANDVSDAFFSSLCLQSGGQLTGYTAAVGGLNFANPATYCQATGVTVADNPTLAQPNVRAGSLYTAYLRVFQNLLAQNPNSFVYINLPDLSRVPAFANASAAQKMLLSQIVQNANAAEDAAATDAGFTVSKVKIDLYNYLANNPSFYNPANFSADGYHPNDTGYQQLAAFVTQSYNTLFPSI